MVLDNIDLICLKESARLLVSKPNKFSRVILKMYAAGLVRPELAKTFRAIYFAVRIIDDNFDFDRKWNFSDPSRENYYQKIRNHIQGIEKSLDLVSMKLYDYAVPKLKEKAQSRDNPEKDFLDELEVIYFDYLRGENGTTLTRKELNEHYRKTFSAVQNITLMLTQSKFRSDDFKEYLFPEIQGNIYAIRDLSKDLTEHILNIPKETLELDNNKLFILLSNYNYKNGFIDLIELESPLIPINTFIKFSEFEDWAISTINNYYPKLCVFQEFVHSEGDFGLKNMCLPLIKDMKNFCNYYIHHTDLYTDMYPSFF